MNCISIRVLAIIRLLLEISRSLSFNSTLSVLARGLFYDLFYLILL